MRELDVAVACGRQAINRLASTPLRADYAECPGNSLTETLLDISSLWISVVPPMLKSMTRDKQPRSGRIPHGPGTTY